MNSLWEANKSFAAAFGVAAAFLTIIGKIDEVLEWLESHWYVGFLSYIAYVFGMYLVIDSRLKADKIAFNNRRPGPRRRRK